MLIIVEGPDGSGKSTLVRALERRLTLRSDARVEVLHRGPPTGHPLDEYVVPLLDYRPHAGRHVVCDRWHLGESVYPAVFGRPTRLDEAVRRYVELFLLSRGALLVSLAAPLDTLRDRIETRGDDLVSVAELPAIVDGYSRALVRSALPNVHVNARSFELDDVVPDVVRLTTMQADAVAGLARFRTYVGPARPRVLLLGDVRGNPRRSGRPLHDPAFMPYPATSGHYLLGVLRRGVVGVANACDVDDFVGLWEHLGEPHVVALGANARRSVRCSHAVSSVSGAVPHPQFWRRFQNSYQTEYGMMIERAALTGEDLLRWRPSGTWDDPAASRSSRSTAVDSGTSTS